MSAQSPLLTSLLKRFVGENDVMYQDYRPLTATTTFTDLNFQKVRGSVRLLAKRVKLEKDIEAFVKKVLETPIP
jgi:hypothetical protein